MQFSFLSHFSSIGIALALFCLMVMAHWLGAWSSSHPRGKRIVDRFGPIEGSLLGLLALLLAFTFSMSASRFDARRQVLVDEANAIGTAILRADLYPASDRQLFRTDFKEYVEARISFHDAGFDEERVNATTRSSGIISGRLWQRAAAIAQNRDSLIPSNNMVPALNRMIDLVTIRNAMRQATVPDSILWILFLLCGVSSFIVGASIKKETEMSWPVSVIFAFMISACVFLIIDLDRPAQGLITLDEASKAFVDLRGLFTGDH